MITSFLLLGLACGGPVDDPIPPTSSPAMDSFDRALIRIDRTLRPAKAYSLDAVASWKTVGGELNHEGKTSVRLVKAGDSRLKLTVGPVDGTPHYVVAADGKEMTRWHAASGKYSVTPCEHPLHDLQSDGTTVRGLRPFGLDLFAHADTRGSLEAQLLRVEDRGESTLNGAKGRVYRLALVGGRTVELAFGPDTDPLPIAMRQTTVIATGEKTNVTRTVDVKLTWKRDEAYPPETFNAGLPADAKKVDDLTVELQGRNGNTDARPATARFTTVDGKAVSLSDFKGKTVVVYAWASWAPASIEGMSKLRDLAKSSADRGVTVLAVNAGETPEAARTALKNDVANLIVVLDPRGDQLATLGLLTVPGIVIVGPDGTVTGQSLKPESVGTALNKILAK